MKIRSRTGGLLTAMLAAAIAMLATMGCGSGDAPQDQCPAYAFETTGTPQEVQGPFSDECIRDHFGAGLTIPDLAPRYSRASFVVDQRRPNVLGVFYEPAETSDPVLKLNLDTETGAWASGFRSVRTVKGTILFITAVPNSVWASIELKGIVYEMFAVGAEPSAADELFLWVADAIERSSIAPSH